MACKAKCCPRSLSKRFSTALRIFWMYESFRETVLCDYECKVHVSEHLQKAHHFCCVIWVASPHLEIHLLFICIIHPFTSSLWRRWSCAVDLFELYCFSATQKFLSWWKRVLTWRHKKYWNVERKRIQDIGLRTRCSCASCNAYVVSEGKPIDRCLLYHAMRHKSLEDRNMKSVERVLCQSVSGFSTEHLRSKLAPTTVVQTFRTPFWSDR